MTKIYGVDLNEKITPLMVRDAISECFSQAHCSDAGVSNQESMEKEYCVEIVKKAFVDSGGDFENPTKESIINSLRELAQFAKKFRNQEVVKKHQEEIMKLVEKLDK